MPKTEKKATAGDHEAGLLTLLQEQFLQVTEQQKCKATNHADIILLPQLQDAHNLSVCQF